MAARPYTSSAREGAKQQTRSRILDALVKVVREEGVHAFTMENVAKRAGVSHRTVYRHFATREALLEGLSRSFDGIVTTRGAIAVPESVDDLVSVIEPVYREFGKRREALSASVVASMAVGYTATGKQQRLQISHAIIDKTFPSLAAQEREEAAAILTWLSSSMTWFHLTSERKLRKDRAARAVTWALRTLFADLTRRNRSK